MSSRNGHIAARLHSISAEMSDVAALMRDASNHEPMPRESYLLASHARELSGAALLAAEWAREIGADPSPCPSEAA